MANHNQHREEDQFDNRRRYQRDDQNFDRNDRNRPHDNSHGHRDSRGQQGQGSYGGPNQDRYRDDDRQSRRQGSDRISARSDFGMSQDFDDNNDRRGYGGMAGLGGFGSGRRHDDDRFHDDHRQNYSGNYGRSDFGYPEFDQDDRRDQPSRSRGNSDYRSHDQDRRRHDLSGRGDYGRSNFPQDSRSSGNHGDQYGGPADQDRGMNRRSGATSGYGRYHNNENFRRGADDEQHLQNRRGDLTFGAPYGSYDASLYGSSFGNEFTGGLDEDYGRSTYGSHEGFDDDDRHDRGDRRNNRR